jgi:hypothetical protein
LKRRDEARASLLPAGAQRCTHRSLRKPATCRLARFTDATSFGNTSGFITKIAEHAAITTNRCSRDMGLD